MTGKNLRSIARTSRNFLKFLEFVLSLDKKEPSNDDRKLVYCKTFESLSAKFEYQKDDS